VNPRAPHARVRSLGPAAYHHVRIEAFQFSIQFPEEARAHLQPRTQLAYSPGDAMRIDGAGVLEGDQHPHEEGVGLLGAVWRVSVTMGGTLQAPDDRLSCPPAYLLATFVERRTCELRGIPLPRT
jgi:hypothetical protein